MLTREMLARLWPHGDSKVPGLIDGIAATAPSVFATYGVTSNLLVAHAMAQFSHECGAGTEMVENLNYSAAGLQATWPGRFDANRAAQFAHKPQQIANTVYNGRMGNRVGSDDGWTFRGRGLSQCTGREGYQKLAAKTGLDLANNPDLVSDPKYALMCGVADFILCGCLEPAKQDDVVQVTRKLNGGQIGLAQRKEWLAKWKAAIAGTGEPTAVAPNAPKPEPPKPPAPHPAAKPVAASGGFFVALAAAIKAGAPLWGALSIALVAGIAVYLIFFRKK